MSSDATLRALTRDDTDTPFWCLKCGHNELHDPDRCTECHLSRGDNR